MQISSKEVFDFSFFCFIFFSFFFSLTGLLTHSQLPRGIVSKPWPSLQLPGPLASHWVHASGSAPCPPQHTPLDVHKWERLRARRGVRAHRAPDASMRVLGTDTRPPLTACAFLMVFPETEEIRSPVALLLCLAMLQARERRPAATHTKGKANPKPPPSSWFQFLPRASHRAGQSPRAHPTQGWANRSEPALRCHQAFSFSLLSDGGQDRKLV